MKYEEFQKLLTILNIEISITQYESLERYKDLLTTWNKKFNLTAIKEEKEIYLKHFYDSLCIYKTKKIKENLKLCDIGTGAGFPGIVLAIFNPNLEITLLESSKKKCDFLKIIIQELNLKNIEVVNERAENYALLNKETFDLITSRAVSDLQILSEISMPLLKQNGYFLPLKANLDKELENSKKIITDCGGIIESVINYFLPIENSERTIPIIKKTNITPKKYPRSYDKIVKNYRKK